MIFPDPNNPRRQTFIGALRTPVLPFSRHCYEHFSKKIDIWSFSFVTFFKEFLQIPKNFPKLFNFFIIAKTIFVCTSLQNHRINLNSAKILLKIQRMAIFLWKYFCFHNFRRPRWQKFGNLSSSRHDFMELPSPLAVLPKPPVTLKLKHF